MSSTLTVETLAQTLRADAQKACKTRAKAQRIPACQAVIDRLGKAKTAIRKKGKGAYVLVVDGHTFPFEKAKAARAAYGKLRTAIRPVLRTLTNDAAAVSVWNRKHTRSEGVGAYLRVK